MGWISFTHLSEEPGASLAKTPYITRFFSKRLGIALELFSLSQSTGE